MKLFLVEENQIGVKEGVVFSSSRNNFKLLIVKFSLIYSLDFAYQCTMIMYYDCALLIYSLLHYIIHRNGMHHLIMKLLYSSPK